MSSGICTSRVTKNRFFEASDDASNKKGVAKTTPTYITVYHIGLIPWQVAPQQSLPPLQPYATKVKIITRKITNYF